jgi:hypothetical protein
MRPSRRLFDLSEAFVSRISRLESLFAGRPFGSAGASEADRLVAYCTLELANAWVQFVRSYYLSCATNAKQRNGLRVKHSASFKDYNDALLQSSRIMGKYVRGAAPTPSEEPDWSSPPTIIRLAQSLRFSNQGEIVTAFGITKSIFQPMLTCRNFYAHRCKMTADKIENLSRTLAVPLQRRATSLLCSSVPGVGPTVFETWCTLVSAVGMALSA